MSRRWIARPKFSTAVRLSLQFSAIYMSAVAVVFVIAYAVTDYEVSSLADDQLKEETESLERLFADEGAASVERTLAALAALDNDGARLILLIGPDGARRLGNVEALDLKPGARFLPRAAIRTRRPLNPEISGYAVRQTKLGEDLLTLGLGDHVQAEALEALAISLVVDAALLALVGLAAGVVVGRRTERQLEAIDATLGLVSGGDLKRRIPDDPRRSEDWRRVAEAINRTLADLERMVETQRQISADVAHDLRTPLQRLRQRLESLGEETDPQIWSSGVDDALDMLDEVMRTFQAILRISEIETNRRREYFAPVDLRRILGRMEDAYGAVAEERGQRLLIAPGEGAAMVHGDAELLTQAAANAVENALRHCPEGATIRAGLRHEGDLLILRVEDDGPGVPEADLAHVFDRFYRVEKSRTTAGNGLGLTLIKAIAEMHGGKALLTNLRPGLRLDLILPVRGASDASAPRGGSA